MGKTLTKEQAISKFWSRVRIGEGDGCWEWIGGKGKGYGAQWFSGKLWLAHRLMYVFSKGEIPEGMMVCHSCDNPGCVNPSHLWIGTNSDNQKDASQKGRSNHPDYAGEKNPRSKITEKDVLTIRKLGEEGKLSRAEISEMFSLSQSQIDRIIYYQEWKSVQ